MTRGSDGIAERPIPRWVAERALPGRRLFFAVPLPPETVATVVALVERVRRRVGGDGPAPRSGDRGGREVRWVRMDGLHLTLRFIGPTLDERLPVLRTLLSDAAAGTRPFEVGIGGVEILPGPAHPRILSLGLSRGGAELGALAGTLDRGLVAAGWPGESRPFRGHLTLARADGVAAGAATAAALAAEVEGFAASWTADRLVLFESLTGGGPARYEPLAEAGFAR